VVYPRYGAMNDEAIDAYKFYSSLILSDKGCFTIPMSGR